MNNNTSANYGSTLRYGMLIPLALMIVSIITSCFSYSNAKQNIADDLNNAMIALARENIELWTSHDTIAAIRQMYKTTNKPLIYQACDANFRNTTLKDEAYFTLSLVDKKNASLKIQGNKIASDSIIIVPEWATDGLAIQVQGFANCSIASIFIASDQTLPGILFSLSILSIASMLICKRSKPIMFKNGFVVLPVSPSLDDIKLTPMQRQLVQMLLAAPNMKVDKRTLCESLWGNKSNAEESLYTLVKRTKSALSKGGMEIVCNRGDSYELRAIR